MNRHIYSCFGETIRSDFHLNLTASSGSAPATIEISAGETALPAHPEHAFEIQDDLLVVSYEQAGRFRIDAQGNIGASPRSWPPSSFFRHFVAMNMVGLSCLRRGRLVLHGSAVATPSGDALLVGESGAGKSTLSLALHYQQFPLICDDVAVMNLIQAPFVEHGVPYVKSWEDSLSVIGIPHAPLAYLSSSTLKCLVPFTPASSEMGLKRIYVLERGDAVRLERLSFGEAFPKLIEHTFMPRGIDLLGLQASHFQNLSRLLRHVSVFRLTRTADFASLEACVRLVGNDASI